MAFEKQKRESNKNKEKQLMYMIMVFYGWYVCVLTTVFGWCGESEETHGIHQYFGEEKIKFKRKKNRKIICQRSKATQKRIKEDCNKYIR